jgi:predicted PurR-regulated permease PerM
VAVSDPASEAGARERRAVQEQAAEEAGVDRREFEAERGVAEADRAPAEREPGDRDAAPQWRRPLLDRPSVRVGVYAWALVGIVLIAIAAGRVYTELSLVIVPFLLAVFPAAVLSVPTTWLKRRMPDSLAALLVLFGFVAVLAGVIAALAPAVQSEFTSEGGIIEQAQQGAEDLQAFVEAGAFGFQPMQLDQLIQQAQDAIANVEGLGGTVLGAASALVEGITGLLLGLVVLFFYLKDGPRIARWARDIFPPRVRPDVEVIGGQTWQTVGGYIRGQVLIAVVDAVLIGIAIVILRVPLALPLSVIVFFGGLFPIVGAFVSGFLAVLVALATVGLVRALILLGVILVIQQVEGDVLAPIVFGRVVRLHPLAVLAALAAGGLLLGVLGAFIAVPVAASLARAVGYIRERVPG